MTNEESVWFLTTFLNIVKDNSIKTINVKKIPRFEESIEKAIEALTEPKIGTWTRSHTGTIGEGYYCSRCGKHGYQTDFCPSCGADMRGEEK